MILLDISLSGPGRNIIITTSRFPSSSMHAELCPVFAINIAVSY